MLGHNGPPKDAGTKPLDGIRVVQLGVGAWAEEEGAYDAIGVDITNASTEAVS